jgi:hypothetical protein
MGDLKLKRDYVGRYVNWEIITSFLLMLKSYDEVFRCFNFPSQGLTRKIIAQFDTFLCEISLPKQIRDCCGKHFGGEPGLGRTLDQLVFVKIYQDYVEPNKDIVLNGGSQNDCYYISNEVINNAVRLVIEENQESHTLNYLIEKQSSVGADYLKFQYSKSACNRFIHRWCISNRYNVQMETDHFRTKLELSEYAINKGYSADGWDISSFEMPPTKQKVSKTINNFTSIRTDVKNHSKKRKLMTESDRIL